MGAAATWMGAGCSAGLLAGCRQRDAEAEDAETDILPLLEAEVYRQVAHTASYLDDIDLMKGMD